VNDNILLIFSVSHTMTTHSSPLLNSMQQTNPGSIIRKSQRY